MTSDATAATPARDEHDAPHPFTPAYAGAYVGAYNLHKEPTVQAGPIINLRADPGGDLGTAWRVAHDVSRNGSAPPAPPAGGRVFNSGFIRLASRSRRAA